MGRCFGKPLLQQWKMLCYCLLPGISGEICKVESQSIVLLSVAVVKQTRVGGRLLEASSAVAG